MNISFILGVFWFAVLAGLSAPVAAEQCQLDNPALQSMASATVTFERGSQAPLSIDVRLADNAMTRAAGFQWVCASVIADKPILFLFDRPRRPSFHMHNVVAPIDIAFIRSGGEIDTIHQMQPYSIMSIEKPLYSPQGLVIAALETQPDFFQKHNIDKKTRIVWSIQE